MPVKFADADLTDLDRIRSFISYDNPAAAERIALAIVAATDRLSDNSRLGRIGAITGTFEIVVRPYVLVYEINRDEIVVLRVWHGRQRRPGT